MLNSFIKYSTETPAFFIALVSAITLAVAYGFQFNGYAPCDLCWYQRYPYMAIIVIVAASLVLKSPNAFWVLFSVTLLAFVDAGIAGYHAGVEYKWWQGPTTCGGAFNFSQTELTLESLNNLAERVVRCDEAAWTLGGISMAGYNMFMALALGLFGYRNLKK